MRNESIFTGTSATAEVMRALDWTSTPLGAPEAWPAALVAHVRAILHVRQPRCILWGKKLTRLYNDAFLPMLSEKHPGAMGTSAEASPISERVLRGDSVIQEEMRVAVTGDTAWFDYSYSPLFDDAGAAAGVLVVCSDVTARVVARRDDLLAIFMQAPLPICILSGPEHRFRLVNEPYMRFIGKRPVLGRAIAEIFTPEETASYLPILDRVLQTGEPVVIDEATLRMSAQGDQFIGVGYYPYRDATGAIAGVLVLIQDVTPQVRARKQVEALAVRQSLGREQANALRAEAEAANRAKDEFLATVSHELRTPLTAILGWASILAEAPQQARFEKGIAVIERNALAQAKIIDDILDVSRIISGKLKIHVRPVDLATVVEAAVESVRTASIAREVDLRVDVEPGLRLVGDEDRLQQVVWNLLSNAVKFTPAGGEVVVRAFQEGRAVHVEVRDTGRGIPPSLLPHVFERFRQGDSSTTKQHAGLGLGLAIVRHLVELHGGTASAHSDGEGAGARFEVVLPLRPVDRRDERPPSEPPLGIVPVPRTSDRPLAEVRALVVDDQQDGRELVAMALEDAGAAVFQAGSAEAAMDLLRAGAVDVIVSDIGMPVEDGYQFVQRVRAADATRDLPALALTAYARAEDRERALASGFHDYLAKPVHPSRLVEAVAALVRGRHEQLDLGSTVE
jgi:signal transduction histidine kinase/ActR/RegA family two-component response regulator